MNIFHILIAAVFVLSIAIFGSITPAFAKYHKMNEADYVAGSCKGIIEARLPDNTRVDCLLPDQAIEYDWQNKWAECIGQALYYGAVTEAVPVCRIICKNFKCKRYLNRIQLVIDEFKLPLRLEHYQSGVWRGG